MRQCTSFVFGIGLVLRVAAAAAQSGSVPPDLQRYVHQPANEQAVRGLIQQQAQRFPGTCPSLTLPTDRISVLIAPQFDAASRPRHGLWKESWSGQRCGMSVTFNVLTAVRDDGSVQHIALLPGATQADMVLQQDAMQQVSAGVGLALPNCSSGWIVTDTAFIAMEGVPTAGVQSPWKERWTAAACGKTVILILHFVPDATGTNTTVNARETVVR
jgi:hypothetical protein